MMHYSIIVSGKVQGVFFRASTKDVADEIGISGFVRNEKDGSVYIEAEADAATLKKFVEWCRQGPPRAGVKNVLVQEGAVQGFKKFEVRR